MNKTTRTLQACVSIVSFALAATLSGQASAQAKTPLVGVWKLVSAQNTDDKGATNIGSFGPKPNGRMMFTESGYYSSINTHPDLPKFASNNRMKGTPEENQAVVQKSIAAFGKYSVSPDGKVLTLHQEGGTWAVRNGKTETREMKLDGDKMSFLTRATYGGTSELKYERVK